MIWAANRINFRHSFVFLAVTLLWAPASHAQSDPVIPGAPHLLPEDTLAYIRLDNAEDLRGDLEGSSIGKMLNDPQLKPFANDVYGVMNDLFDQVSRELGVSLDELLAIPHGQVAAAAMPAKMPEEVPDAGREDEDDESPEAIRRRIDRRRRQQNSIAGMFIINAGRNVNDLMTLVERMERALLESGYVRRTENVKKTELVRLLPPRQGRPEIEYFEKDDTVVLGIGHDTAAAALNHWLDDNDEPTLADNANFGSVMSRCVGAESTRPQLTFYIDPYHIVERIFKMSGGATALVWPMVEELGISKIRGVGGSAFRGGEVFEDITHFHVLIDSPRDGIFGVLRPETGDPQPPKWVPSDVTSYATIHWNFEATFDNVGKIIETFQGPEAMKRFVEDPAQQEFGIDFRREVLENFTGRYVTGAWMQRPVKLNSQSRLHALELVDPSKLKTVITKFRDKNPNDIEIATIGSTVVYQSRQRNPRNFPEGLRRPEPGVAILGNWAIFTDSRKLMEQIIKANSGATQRLADLPEYELIMSELGGKLDGEKPFMISFLKSSDFIRQMYDLAKSEDSRRFLRQAGGDNPVAARIAGLLERNELPPFEKFEKYFAPSGTFAYDEASGMHMGSFTLRADASAEE